MSTRQRIKIFIGMLAVIMEIILVYACATTQGDWEKASKVNTISAYQEFISKHPESEYNPQARKRIEEIEYEKAKQEDTINGYGNFLKKYPKTNFAQQIRERIRELTILDEKKKEFHDKFQQCVFIQECEQLINQNKKYEIVKGSILRLEDKIIEEIRSRRIGNRLVIRNIQPIYSGPKGKICFVGNGQFVRASDTRRLGEKVVIGTIISMGDLNLSFKGDINHSPWPTTSIYVRPPKPTKGAIFSVDFDSPTYSPGAIWKKVESVVDKDNKINFDKGIHFVKGIRIGSLYGEDCNIQIDYVRVDSESIILPGGADGTIHRFIGVIRIGAYTFIGENDLLNPLTFVLLKDLGYVYLRGKGKVMSNTREFKLGY